MKKILFATSEAVPFIKTGGLADVAGSLPKFFDKEKYDVRVMLPKYMCMKESWKEKLQYKTHFYMDLGWRTQYVGVLETEYEGVTFYFIDNEFYFNCGIAAANITDDIFANGGCDALNAVIGGFAMFRDLIGLEDLNGEKVKRRRILYDFNDKPYAIKGDCPRCGAQELISISEQYCPKCGLKLDWSEDEK